MPDKLPDLIHHITTLCSPDELGRTRLAKILWFADVDQYRRTGKTITGSDDYVKDEFGPRHKYLYAAIEELAKSGKVEKVARPTPAGVRHELFPKAHPDVSKFTAEEIAVVDRVTAFVCQFSAKQASDITHDEVWDSAEIFERIPVAAVASVPGEITPEIIKWAEASINEYSKAS